mmetsp:Transcript_1753/g.6311  ORF Transcript_1753/g.6311 Transcript_1753/m.6311 type:complete len:172 (+) Transcript_1753:418-933(+)
MGPVAGSRAVRSGPRGLVNSMMQHGRNNGKKIMAVRIIKHAFEIIHLLTDQNPVQVCVDAIINSGPREDATRIGSAGVIRRQAVDISPLRRVNQVRTRVLSAWPRERADGALAEGVRGGPRWKGAVTARAGKVQGGCGVPAGRGVARGLRNSPCGVGTATRGQFSSLRGPA